MSTVLSSAAPAPRGVTSGLDLCLKNCTSTIAQLSGHILLLVTLASAYSMLSKVSKPSCCTPNISISRGLLEAFISQSLQERLEGSTVK